MKIIRKVSIIVGFLITAFSLAMVGYIIATTFSVEHKKLGSTKKFVEIESSYDNEKRLKEGN